MLAQRDGDLDFVKVLDFGLAEVGVGRGDGGLANAGAAERLRDGPRGGEPTGS